MRSQGIEEKSAFKVKEVFFIQKEKESWVGRERGWGMGGKKG